LISQIRNLKVSLSDQEKNELKKLCALPDLVKNLYMTADEFHRIHEVELSDKKMNTLYRSYLKAGKKFRKTLKELKKAAFQLLNDIKLSNKLGEKLNQYYALVLKRLDFCLMLSHYMDGPSIKSKLRMIENKKYSDINKEHIRQFGIKKSELTRDVDKLFANILKRLLLHIQKRRGEK